MWGGELDGGVNSTLAFKAKYHGLKFICGWIVYYTV